MKLTRSAVLTGAAVVVLIAAIPSAIRDTLETGRVYVFSRQFLEELPQRLTGPGRFRFIIQPLMAIVLGLRAGLGDVRTGRPPYLLALLTDAAHRKEQLHSMWTGIRNVVALGIVLDALAQLLIYRQVHPGAALLIGPVLISVPYVLSRGACNRVAGRRDRTRTTARI